VGRGGGCDLCKGWACSRVLVPALLHEHDVLRVASKASSAGQVLRCRQLRPLRPLSHQRHNLSPARKQDDKDKMDCMYFPSAHEPRKQPIYTFRTACEESV